MILTPLNIQIAIIKAWYSIALKSIKYYAGLAVGKNNPCLLKEARLLRKYVEILRNFKIVGSTITCSCCLEGDYTVLLNDLTELTEAKIQFSCDNEGSMYFDGVNYPFDYVYDADNSNLVLNFTTLVDPITEELFVLNMQDITFLPNCDFTTSTISPIEEALVDEVTGIPVTVNNMYGDWSGNITVYAPPPGSTILHTLTIPAAIMDDPEAIVDYWNTNGPTDWILFYDGTQYTMITPFDGTNYSGYIIEFNQYEGGVDSTINTTFIPRTFIPVGTRASREFDIANTFVGSVQAQGLITPYVPDFVTSNTPALVKVTIPSTSFSSTQVAASMTISINGGGAFGSSPPSNQYFYYNSTLMFNHIGPYTDPAALVLDFNNNNGNGFNMTYIGPSSTPNNFIFEIDSPADGEPYNGNTITVAYNALPYPDDVGTFSGGVSPKPATITVSDTVNGTIYNITSPLFNSLQDFIDDFNTNPFGYVAFIVPLAVSNNVEITAPPSTGFAFNGNTLTYSTTGRTYSSTGTYSGGIDTTECTYTLEVYDTGNVLFATIDNLTPTNYIDLANVATDINANPLNTYSFYTATAPITGGLGLSVQFPHPFVLPQSLICNTYNGYTFILTINYTSPQYLPYTSVASMIDGGINAVSNEFEISDTANGILFSRATGAFNYPNGSEIQNGLIPDFNANNLFNYTAQYVSAGTPIPPQPSISNNFFISQLTAATISNGEEIRAYIDNVYIGKYQAPVTGVLPSYNQMILNLTNDIIAITSTSGIGVSCAPLLSPTTITLVSPTGQEVAYNGKQFIINKIVYTPATVSVTFGSASPNTIFTLRAGLTTICNYNQAAPTPGTGVAILVESLINSSGTNYTATRVGATVTISGPPFTGSALNGTFLLLKVDQGSIVINSTTYNFFPAFIFITSFSGGLITPSLIKQEPFAGGVGEILTTKIKVLTPIQTSGVGNWAFNSEFLSYNYNLGEYVFNGVYSGGVDTTIGRLYVEILDSTLNPLVPPLILYDDGSTPQNYLSRQSLVNIFNNLNSTPPPNFQINLLNPSSSSCIIQSPTNSFEYFNAYNFRYSYNYESLQYDDYIDITSTFSNGIDPTLTSYTGEFVNGDIGTFVTSNPCEPTTAEQECLSNADITNIIRHIDRIVK
jgi:hypothetical protein